MIEPLTTAALPAADWYRRSGSGGSVLVAAAFFEHVDLLPQSEDFQPGIDATANEHADGSQECGDQPQNESTVVTPSVTLPRSCGLGAAS
jgi:hypothetical protein